MGFMMGGGRVILAKIEIDYKIFHEIAIHFSSSIERQIGKQLRRQKADHFSFRSPVRQTCVLYMPPYQT